MRGRLRMLDRRLRHAASRFQETGQSSDIPQELINCFKTQKLSSVCNSLGSKNNKIPFFPMNLYSNESLLNGTFVSGNFSEKPAYSNESLLNGTFISGNFSEKPAYSNESLLNGIFISGNSSDKPTHETGDEDDQKQLFKIVVPVMLTICVISLLFNMVIAFSVRWLRKSLSPTLYLSLSLAVADAYASLVIGLGVIVNTLLPIVYEKRLGLFNMCYVLVLEAFRLGGCVVAVLHLLALAINHYIGILRPLHYAATITKGTVFWAIGAMWLLPNVFFLAYFSLVPGDGFQSEYCNTIEFLLRIPFRATFSALFFVPLILMSVMYMHMFVVVKRHQRGLLQLPSSRQLHKSVKAIITTLLILGTYFIGWMPAVLYYVLTCLDCPVPFTQIPLGVRVTVGLIINALIPIKSFVDPIIYVVRMPEIKAAMRSLYRTRCGLVADEHDHSLQSKSEMNRLTLMSSKKHKENNSPNGCVGREI